MSTTAREFDVEDVNQWHRYFAIECNNRAWALVEGDRSPEHDREMLNVAHAAAFHWSVVGDQTNRMRADLLLAEVHAIAGLGRTAWALASRVHDFFLGADTPDWEVAFNHVVHAHAAHAAGERTAYVESYQQAAQALDAIASTEDREVVERTFRQVPSP